MIVEIDLINDRDFSVDGGRALHQGCVFKTENEDPAGIGTIVIEATGPGQGLGQGDALGLKGDLLVASCGPQHGNGPGLIQSREDVTRLQGGCSVWARGRWYPEAWWPRLPHASAARRPW